jgi:predicted Zn-ribbon and HTH transcriptional regulator
MARKLVKCFQCGWKWFPRISKPNFCPNCGSIHWHDKSYKLKKVGRPRTTKTQ